jgi:hypothetical protein
MRRGSVRRSNGEVSWRLRGRGYEFCNCDPGCTCNFTGEPNSRDGSCKTAIGFHVFEGFYGDVDLSDLKTVFIVDWPAAIHQGGGRAVLCFDPDVPEVQVERVTEIMSGRAGGMPWIVASTTFEIVSIVRANLEFIDDGMRSKIAIEGIGAAAGTTLTHPSTGKENLVSIVFPHGGFIFDRADCGKGDFRIDVLDLHFDFLGTNWLNFEFNWSNAA